MSRSEPPAVPFEVLLQRAARDACTRILTDPQSSDELLDAAAGWLLSYRETSVQDDVALLTRDALVVVRQCCTDPTGAVVRDWAASLRAGSSI